MAVINLNTSTYTAVPAGLLQVRSGLVQLADSASPATNDYIVLSAGDLIVTSAEKFALGRGAGAKIIQQVA